MNDLKVRGEAESVKAFPLRWSGDAGAMPRHKKTLSSDRVCSVTEQGMPGESELIVDD